jgi:hypothetical protein
MRILEVIFGAAAAVAVAFREDFVGQPRPAPGARRRARGVAPVSADPTAGSLQLAQAQSGSGTDAREQGNSGQRDSGASRTTVGVRSAASDESVIVKRKKAKRGRAGQSGGASGGASSGGRESPSGRQ